jgi:hypothetical protein
VSSKSDAKQPTIRAWLATRPGIIDGRPWTERQMEVLEQAARRGFLFDPDPEPFDFLGSDMNIRDRHWPEVREVDRPGHWAE